MNPFDREEVLKALREHANPTEAARALGIPPRTLRDRIARGMYAEGASVEDGPTTEDMLRREIKTLKAALEQHRSRAVSAAVLEDAIRQAVQGHPMNFFPQRFPKQGRENHEAHHRHVLLLSDFHGGERVDPAAVHGLNTYDWAIQEERVEQLIAAVVSPKANAPEVTGLDILLLGDMCSGAIHKELAETNEYGIAEQAVRMGHLLFSIVLRLSAFYPDFTVSGVVGNHGRLDKAPAAKEIHQNWDWVAYKLVQAYAEGSGDEHRFHFPESASLIHEVAGRNLYVWHGDGIRSSMPGVPWGGVMRRVNSIASTHAQAGVRIDHFIHGHYHQANVVDGGRIIGNGSLKGTDEWVQKSFGGGSPPTQLLLEFDEAKQRLTTVRYLTPTAGLS